MSYFRSISWIYSVFSYLKANGHRPALIDTALRLFASSEPSYNPLHLDSVQFSHIVAFMEYNRNMPLGAIALPHPSVPQDQILAAFKRNDEALGAVDCFLNQPISTYYTNNMLQEPNNPKDESRVGSV